MMGPSFSLSLAAVDIVSQTLNVNARLFPFEIPSVGQFQTDRIRIARAVFTDLAKRGLVRQGDLVPDLTLALRTLSDYQIAVAAMGTVEQVDGKKGTEDLLAGSSIGKEILARASATQETGVLAVQDGQMIRLELIRPSALAVSMVGLLPKMEPGPGQSVTLTQLTPGSRRDDEQGGYFQHVHGPGGSSARASRLAESYLTRPRTGAGFFAVSGRNRQGKEVRAGELGWVDTDAGRYLTLSRPPDEDGQAHNTVSPADAARLTQQLGQLIESVKSTPHGLAASLDKR
jgi:hypothetical protein